MIIRGYAIWTMRYSSWNGNGFDRAPDVMVTGAKSAADALEVLRKRGDHANKDNLYSNGYQVVESSIQVVDAAEKCG